MNIDEIKSSLNIDKLILTQGKDKDGANTNWARHWDGEKRVAVVMEIALMKKIKADKAKTDNLMYIFKEKASETSGEMYKMYVVVEQADVLAEI